VGKAAFRTLELALTPQVLIPRPETEDLVGQVLAWAAARHPGGPWGTVADIGTGSGAIALALAVEGEFERVIATEVSPDALDVARSNLEAVKPRTPVELRLGPFLAPLLHEQVDVIVANPPYLTTAEYEALGADVRDHEPRLALDGGPDGLAPYRVLFAGAGRVLVAGGLLALEIDSRRPDQMLALARAARWSDARTLDDVFGRPRYLLATNEKRTM
jgi:release factor glutamine methyltransferase